MTTSGNWLFILTFLTTLGCGLIAGTFFAFSTFVMPALARLSAGEGIRAMQTINVTVISPLFMGVFVGTGLTSAVAIVSALLHWQEKYAVYLLAGGVFYLIGCFLVTMLFNVPKNEALAAVTAVDPNSTSLWAGYLTSWTLWNHLRALASLIATAFLIVALCQ